LTGIRKSQKMMLGRVAESLNLTEEQGVLLKDLLVRSINYFDQHLELKLK